MARTRTRYGNRYTTKTEPAWSYALSVALGVGFVPATFGLSLLAIPVLCAITYKNSRPYVPFHRRSEEWKAEYQRDMAEQMARLKARIEADRRG